MALEMGLWRADGGKLSRITPVSLKLEAELEDFIESDPTLLGEGLMIIGRQVLTLHGGYIDLLAMDEAGTIHIIELKRDKTPRDVTAQALDYGQWVASLGRAEVIDIFEAYSPNTPFEEAFAEQFGTTPPDDLNSAQVFTIVASTVDSATERIVRFLNEDYGVPINVVFFRHFLNDGTSLLARTWLVDQEVSSPSTGAAKKRKSRETWNGHDWYVSFGESPTGRRWDDAATYGFVSAGGDKWFSRTLKNLPVGARVFACIPKSGYVGVGTVLAEARRFDETTVEVDGTPTPLTDLPLSGNYRRDGDEDDDSAEWAVPVEWIQTVPRESAIWRTGMFANQNSATRLRNQFTLEQIKTAFEISD